MEREPHYTNASQWHATHTGKQRKKHFYLNGHLLPSTHAFSILFIALTLTIALPLTVYLALQNQDLRQHADDNNPTGLGNAFDNGSNSGGAYDSSGKAIDANNFGQNGTSVNGNDNSGSQNMSGDINGRLGDNGSADTNNGTSAAGNAQSSVDQSNPRSGQEVAQYGLSSQQAADDAAGARQFYDDVFSNPNSTDAMKQEATNNLATAIANEQRATSTAASSASLTQQGLAFTQDPNGVGTPVTTATSTVPAGPGGQVRQTPQGLWVIEYPNGTVTACTLGKNC